jgi:hypothetical protein
MARFDERFPRAERNSLGRYYDQPRVHGDARFDADPRRGAII